MTVIRIEPPQGPRDTRWLELRCALWPDSTQAHLRDMHRVCARGDHVLLALTATGDVAGFVEASMRHDYVNGTNGSPVAFLEGLYVQAALRRMGVARQLVAAVERWARAEGVSELASDTPLSNVASQAVHRALGFDETERVVYFHRALR